MPHAHTELHRRSFGPTTVSDWNELPNEVRNCPSRKSLKSRLLKKPTPNPYYNLGGARVSDINLTRLRSMNPNLNSNLFHRGLADDPGCSCGVGEEISHYLLDCYLYDVPRQEAIDAVGL